MTGQFDKGLMPTSVSEQKPPTSLLGSDGVPLKTPEELGEQECFNSFTKLAARVTNLRTILQEPEVIQPGEAQAWAEDVRSVVQDFIILTEQTRAHVLRRLPKEPNHG